MILNYKRGFDDCPVAIKLTAKDIAAIEEKTPKFFIYDRKRKKGYCTNCEKTIQYAVPRDKNDLERTIYPIGSFKSRDLVTCPRCKKELIALPNTTNYFASAWTLITKLIGKEIRYAIVESAFTYSSEERNKKLGYDLYIEAAGTLSAESQKQYICFNYGRWGATKKTTLYDVNFRLSIPEKEALRKTIRKSFLKTFGVEGFCFPNAGNAIETLRVAAKYPQVEYLLKMGMKEIVINKINGVPNHIRPNWRAKTLPAFLRLSAQDVDKLRQWEMLDVGHISTYQELKKTKKKITKEDVRIANDFIHELRRKKLLTSTNLGRLSRYLEKVYRYNQPGCHAGAAMYGRYQVVAMYDDYIRMLKACNYPENDFYTYPPDLPKAHDKLVDEYNKKRKKEEMERLKAKNERFKKIVQKLEKLTYQNGEFLIRPLRSHEEFYEEGKNNINCVASYFERASEGKTSIFVIRKLDDPDKSFVTVEFKDKKIIQIRGQKNSGVSEDVQKFADEWLTWMKQKKKEAA